MVTIEELGKYKGKIIDFRLAHFYLLENSKTNNNKFKEFSRPSTDVGDFNDFQCSQKCCC